ncbi:MAG: hypothetical protein GXO75_15285 [Calditrichaeota bacterium]|nr:hypothetical protein [Calditrichota bacterium]
MFILACSSGNRYKWLSFFFDDVPNPNAKIAKTDSLQADSSKSAFNARQIRPSKPLYIFHAPYQEKACDDCHDLAYSSRLLQPQPQLCYQCHEDFKEQFAVLHGPVASGHCTACHNPHMAKNKKLLKRKGQQLCLYCHELSDILKNDVHQDIDNTDCTECHNPHGGEDEYLLN